MSEVSKQPSAQAPPRQQASPGGKEVVRSGMEPERSGGLVTDSGKTAIADSVVTKIAGLAAREVSGVHAMGSSGARAFGTVRDRLPGTGAHTGVSQGVSVEVGERQAAIDLDLVVDYGVSIPDVASSVRTNVTQRVERMTGLEVTEVNISVDDIWLGDDEESDDEPRVQ